jgi:hypothetical protein
MAKTTTSKSPLRTFLEEINLNPSGLQQSAFSFEHTIDREQSC